MEANFILLLLIGLVIGTLAGMLGIGGGILMIPALLYLPPMLGFNTLDIKAATGVAASQALASSLSASWVHYKNENMIPALVLILGGSAMLGGYLGGLSTGFVPEIALKFILIGALGSVIVLYLKRKAHQSDEKKLSLSIKEAFGRRNMSRSALCSVGIGYLSGLLGIGGSIFLIPLMYTLLMIPTKNTIGTGTGTVFLIALASFFGKLQLGFIPFEESITVTLGAFVGGVIGARLTNRFSSKFLKHFFLSLMILALLRVLMELLS